MKSYLWTNQRARLQFVQTNLDGHFNWIFLPGGPGLGSESLRNLIALLNLPGSMWALDFPGDGSNTTPDDTEAFSHWSEALVEAISALENVILIAHSSGGMFALATPALEKLLTGLVLMDSAPDASWQREFINYTNLHVLPEVENLQKIYTQLPSNETLKKLTLASAPWFSTEKSLKKNIALFETLPYNYKSFEWAAKHFDSYYQAKWAPKNIPALIFAGDNDHITPLQLFLESKEFQHDNILIRAIKDAGHFPWMDNPDEVIALFKEFQEELR